MAPKDEVWQQFIGTKGRQHGKTTATKALLHEIIGGGGLGGGLNPTLNSGVIHSIQYGYSAIVSLPLLMFDFKGECGLDSLNQDYVKHSDYCPKYIKNAT